MSAHLPECQRWFTDMPAPDECPACEMFRACEARVLEGQPDPGISEKQAIANHAIYRNGYAAGLAAARDAVAAIHEGCNCYEDTGIRDDALAAIDGLAKDGQR